MDDFYNDLYPRDFLKRILDACPPPLRIRLGAVVEKLDKRFFESTIEVSEPVFGSKEEFSKKEFPWHYRKPILFKEGEFEDYTGADEV